MRIRRLLVVALIVGVSSAAMSSVAGASGAVEEDRACIEKVADAKQTPDGEFYKALDNCRKAKSLIVPAVSEMLWGGLAFLIVAGVLMKFAFPSLRKGIKAREEKIRYDLEGAEQSRIEAEAERSRYEAQIGDARSEANGIIEEARRDADRVRKDLLAKAESDSAEVRQRANEDLQLARDRALSDVQQQVTDISIGLAEKIVEHNLDPATQQALVESYINSVDR